MRFRFHFLHVDVSDSLQNYCRESFGRLGRFLLKESTWNVSFSKGRHSCKVQIDVRSPWGHFKATSQDETFYLAVDKAAEKVSKQFQKRKEVLQHHKKFQHSKRAKILRLNPQLETEHQLSPNKKVA